MLKTKITIFLGIFFFALVGCSKIAQPEATRVEVRDPDFEVIKVIDGGDELSLFNEIWGKKEKQGSQQTILMRYKLDVADGERSTRWLYSEHGWTQVLTVKKSKQYKIEDAEAFNALLGILTTR